MKAKGKKFVSLFLIFSLVVLSANLYAKERRGAKLIITKLDGQLIEGELITVKPNSLLLLDTEGKDVSVGIEDIKVIKIVEKPGVAAGAVAGLLTGVAFAALRETSIVLRIVILGPLSWWQVAGALTIVGAILGAFLKESKKIKIEGMSDSEIQETMDKLRKKARIRDYK